MAKKGLKFGTKIILGNVSILILLLIISLVSFLMVRSLIGSVGWVNHTHDVINTSNLITLSLVNMETGQRGFLVGGKEEFLKPWHDGKNDFEKYIKKAKYLVKDNSKQVERFNKVEKMYHEWVKKAAQPEIDARKKVLTSSDNDKANEMQNVVDLFCKATGKQYMDSMRAQIDEIIKIEEKLMAKRINDQKSNADITIYTTTLGTLIAIIIGLGIAIILTRGLLRQLGGEPALIEDIATRIANGDLTMELKSERKSETGVFLAIKQMLENLKIVVGNTLDVSTNLAASTEEINATAKSLAEGAQNQAASAQQVSASTEELVSSINQVADHTVVMKDNSQRSLTQAKKYKEDATSYLTEAQSYKEVMQRASQEITSISNSTEQIGEVVNVINDIADQTKLLSLNAAIEAARAGEHGRGFAVVAEAISTLASNTAESTKEIQTLIKESITLINRGVTSVGESAKSFDKLVDTINTIVTIINTIVASIEENSNVIEDISNSIQQQKEGGTQIATATQEVTDITSNVSSSAEELASNTSELHLLAEKLNSTVNIFKINAKSMLEENYSRNTAMMAKDENRY